MRTATALIVSASLFACSQKSRGPASTEAKDLMRDAPPPVVADGVAPTEPEVTVPSPSPSQPVQPPAEVAVQPAPGQPAPLQPAQPVVPPQPSPDLEVRRSAATAPVTSPAMPVMRGTAATVPATGPLARPMRIHYPADADEATRLRNWPVSVASYANGNTVAGPVYRLVPAPPKTNRYRDVVIHEAATTALAVPQIIVTPLWMLVNPPWKAVEYHGDEIPPSYTLDEEVPYYQKEKVPGIVEIGR